MNWAQTAQPGQAACREKACRRPIRWGITEAGKHQAVDLGVDPDGNLAVYRDGTGTLKIRVLKAGQEPEPYERRAMPHAATCAGRETRPVTQRDGTLSLAAVRDRKRRSKP